VYVRAISKRVRFQNGLLVLNTSAEDGNVDVLNCDVGVNDIGVETTTSGGDHVELIIGQLDRGFDKFVNHLFLQDLVDDREEFQGSSFLMKNFSFIGEALQKIIG
jgi:hypothetical protein